MFKIIVGVLVEKEKKEQRPISGAKRLNWLQRQKKALSAPPSTT